MQILAVTFVTTVDMTHMMHMVNWQHCSRGKAALLEVMAGNIWFLSSFGAVFAESYDFAPNLTNS